MNPWRWVDPRVGEVKIEQLRDYLTARGWRVAPGAPPGRVCFQGPAGRNGDAGRSGVLPDSELAADYVLSLTYFLTALSEAEDRHPVAILEEILAAGTGRPEAALARVHGS
jgi:hypothetical protein